jgi:hypothetical protein
VEERAWPQVQPAAQGHSSRDRTSSSKSRAHASRDPQEGRHEAARGVRSVTGGAETCFEAKTRTNGNHGGKRQRGNCRKTRQRQRDLRGRQLLSRHENCRKKTREHRSLTHDKNTGGSAIRDEKTGAAKETQHKKKEARHSLTLGLDGGGARPRFGRKEQTLAHGGTNANGGAVWKSLGTE